MLSYNLLIELGLADDADTLRARLVGVAEAMGFGLVSAVITRGSPWGKQAVRWVGNTPEAFVQASVNDGNTKRDPVMSQLSRRAAPLTYDQATYVQAGAGDLWELQAPFGYRAGVAASMHAGSHEESFCLGIDRPDALPTDQAGRMRLMAELQLAMAHAQAAAARILMPSVGGASVAAAKLTKVERDGLLWAADGRSVWTVSDRLNLTVHETRGLQARAARKLGERSVKAAQLRVIRGAGSED